MRTIIASIFVTIFAVSLAAVSYFNHFYAERALQRDTEQLLFEFHDALVEAKSMLAGLPEPDDFRCNDKTYGELVHLSFENPAIRLLGVLHDNEEYCASDAVTVDLSAYKSHALSGGFSMASAAHGDEHTDLLLVRTHGNSRYFANLNPFLINHLAEHACLDCLSYEITIQGEPTINFFGEPLSQAAYIEFDSFRKEGPLGISLSIKGTREFFEYYKELSWVSTVAFAVIVASVLSFAAYRLLTIRQSLGRVIKDALRFSEFVPFYQPIVDSRNGQVLGAEVLARWRRGNGEIVPPYQFIPFAEDSGLIIEITEQLVEKVTADLKRFGWNKTGQFASVNIVPEHLDSDVFYKLLTQGMERHGLIPKNISLEITERRQIANLAQARKALDAFFEYGIDLKLDDAGTGYGGFSYVQELGISTLKIDKMFVDTIQSDDVKRSVLDAIIAFAKSSELKTIAEGVEDKAQVEYLEQHGVYAIQGYVYAKPMPAEDLVGWLAKNESEAS